jgi:hypothetical protein
MTTEYGVQINRPGKAAVTYPCADLADAHKVQQDWAAAPGLTSTYTVVSRTVTDWAPVDPMEARP